MRKVVAFLVLLLCAGMVASAATGYHLIKKIPIADDGGWDYQIIDPAARRMYISHSTHVLVLDIDTSTVVGNIPDTDGVHGVALATELGRGFTSNGRAATATVFDLKTLQKLGEAKTGKNPDAILYEPFTKRVLTFNGGSNDSTVVDAAKGTVLGTIALGGKPEFAASDGKGKAWVNLEDKSMVLELDPKSMTVKNRWPLAPCEEPSGLALDAKNRRLFVGCGNKMMAVMDADTGKVVTTLPIGDGVDSTWFDPELSYVFNSAGDGTVTVARQESADKYTVVDTLKTQNGSRTMALDMKTHQLFLPAVEFGPAPARTAANPRPRPERKPGTFAILIFGR